jgi:Amidase
MRGCLSRDGSRFAQSLPASAKMERPDDRSLANGCFGAGRGGLLREASSEQVIDAHLRRIEACRSTRSRSFWASRRWTREGGDRLLASGAAVAPLHGVPLTVKDNIDVAGSPTTQGARAMSGAYPACDAPSVERLRAASAIPIGRTNLPTFGMGWVCESEMWGAIVNPWDRSLTPGGLQRWRGGRACHGDEPIGARERRPRFAAVARSVLRDQPAADHARPDPARDDRRAAGYSD